MAVSLQQNDVGPNKTSADAILPKGRHIRALLGDKKLRGAKYGRDWMITADDLAVFEETYKPNTGRLRGGTSKTPRGNQIKTRKSRPRKKQ